MKMSYCQSLKNSKMMRKKLNLSKSLMKKMNCYRMMSCCKRSLSMKMNKNSNLKKKTRRRKKSCCYKTMRRN